MPMEVCTRSSTSPWKMKKSFVRKWCSVPSEKPDLAINQKIAEWDLRFRWWYMSKSGKLNYLTFRYPIHLSMQCNVTKIKSTKINPLPNKRRSKLAGVAQGGEMSVCLTRSAVAASKFYTKSRFIKRIVESSLFARTQLKRVDMLFGFAEEYFPHFIALTLSQGFLFHIRPHNCAKLHIWTFLPRQKLLNCRSLKYFGQKFV